MLDKILFWVVLVWMVALLIMAFRAVREVWIEDSQETDQPDDTRPTGTDAPEKKPDIPAAGQ
ncbi:MAG: hypothetical protein E6L09_03275 [Verrucomicrobia bacterium]|nr:MAG: hypothetical protein E6L09_03275 [Verrucomicrobiota bacterium]